MAGMPAASSTSGAAGGSGEPAVSTPPNALDVAALLRAVVAVSAGLDVDEVLGSVVRSACELVGARYGALGVLSPRGEALVGFIPWGMTPEQLAAIGDPPRGHGILGLLIGEPEALRLGDIAAHPAAVGFPPGHPPMTSFLGAPIRVRGQVFGHLYLTDKIGADEFSAADQDLLVALAAATGVAIENARLYAATQRQNRWARAITTMSRSLLRGERPRAALDLLVREAVAGAEADLAVVALCEEGDGPLVIEAAVGPDPHGCAGMLGSLIASPHWIEVLAARQPLLLVTRAGESDADPPAGALRVAAGLAAHGATALAPITVGERATGLLVVGWPEGNEWLGTANMEGLSEYAEQAGLTLAAASSQRDRARTSILEDRDRIARDMHDLVIQRLYATGLSLQGALRLGGREPDAEAGSARGSAGGLDEAVARRIDDAIDELDLAIKEIRSTIFELHRTKDVGHVLAEIQEVISGFLPTLSRAPTLRVAADLDALGEDVQHDVVAVIREGLANAVRHAQARHVEVSVVATGVPTDGDPTGAHRHRELVVEVRDDGIGLPAELTRRSGLANLTERAHRHAGRLDLGVNPAGGVRLTWAVPLPAGSSPSR